MLRYETALQADFSTIYSCDINTDGYCRDRKTGNHLLKVIFASNWCFKLHLLITMLITLLQVEYL